MFGIQRFANEKDGAVTLDWVVLTVAIVVLGLIVRSSLEPAINEVKPTEATETKD